MPKMKSKRGASKRFKLTASGKVKRFHAFAGHIMTKKSPKRKRNLRDSDLVSKTEEKKIKRLILAWLMEEKCRDRNIAYHHIVARKKS